MYHLSNIEFDKLLEFMAKKEAIEADRQSYMKITVYYRFVVKILQGR